MKATFAEGWVHGYSAGAAADLSDPEPDWLESNARRTLTTEAGVSLDEVEDELVYLFEEVGADDNIPALALARRVIAILTRIKKEAPRD